MNNTIRIVLVNFIAVFLFAILYVFINIYFGNCKNVSDIIVYLTIGFAIGLFIERIADANIKYTKNKINDGRSF